MKMFNEQENLQSSSNKEQTRSTLLNDPNFGTVLSFLEKFRSVLDLPVYFYERLENHLVETENRGSSKIKGFSLHRKSIRFSFSSAAFDRFSFCSFKTSVFGEK